MGVSSSLIANIRAASRELVRELGFMNRSIAGTDLSASAVHAIVEIGAAGGLSAKELSQKLLLEKSTVSRLVKSLISKGEIREAQSVEDARSKLLHLTSQGENTLTAITRFAEQQIEAALAPLEGHSRQKIIKGLETYSTALRISRTSVADITANSRAVIKEGFVSCLIGRVVEMHAGYYNSAVGFSAAFEAKVAGDLAEFVTRHEGPKNGLWYAEQDGRIVGSIAIDGEDLGVGLAHLRWFIVDDGLRGAGVGNKLLQLALQFCDDHSFHETHLWTFKGLDAAKRLYERNGFSLAEEYFGDQWGTVVQEQKFVRPSLL